MIRVLVADDEPLIRAGIRAVLNSAGDLEVVAEAEDGRAAIEAARSHRPDVALLDIRMPVLDGLATLAELQRSAPGLKVVMVSTFATDEHVSRALRSGSAGFIVKDSAPHELIAAVRSAAAGNAYLSPKVTRQVVDQLAAGAKVPDPDAADRVAVLTNRERDILLLLAEGLPNNTIARRLHMSEATIRTYVSRILAKLQCENRVQAAILAHNAGLSRPDDTSLPRF
jgi:DNA-binding NarL/FixJ family response regulator